jgi:hypothetical protein
MDSFRLLFDLVQIVKLIIPLPASSQGSQYDGSNTPYLRTKKVHTSQKSADTLQAGGEVS